MIRTSITSSIIKSAGHEGDSLEVEFNNGQVYIYSGVPAKEYNALMAASSPGKYFIANIKQTYTYKKA